MASFQFDGVNKLIYIIDDGQNTNGIDRFDAQYLYSEWKRWLVNDVNNIKYPQAMRSIGGDQITDTKYIAPYIEVLVNNGWRIKPYSGNYTLIVEGNLFGTGGKTPFIGADSGTVNIILETTGNALALQTSSTQDDITAPVWESSVGITDAYQNGEFINISWGKANDNSGEVRYRVYISTSDTTLFDATSVLGDFDGNFLAIGTEADGLTKLRDSIVYYISVRAVDKYGNETTNTNYAQVTFYEPYNIQTDIQEIKSMLNTLLDIEQGNWEITTSGQMIFYDRNGQELMRFDLLDENNNATIDRVFKRRRV